MEKPKGIPILRAACLVFTLLLMAMLLRAAEPVNLPARTYIVTAEVMDAGNKPVPDALVLVRLNAPNSTTAIDTNDTRVQESFTNLAGRVRILVPVGMNQSTPSASLTVYLPYWSSQPVDLNFPDRPLDVFDRKIVLPVELNTYRVRLSDKIGNPVSAADVQFMQPYPLYHKTDANGLVQVRLPPGMAAGGYIQYQGYGQNFSFENVLHSSVAFEKTFIAPLPGRVRAYNQSEDWTVQLIDAMGRPMVQQTVSILGAKQNWVYVTDRSGRLFLRGLPENRLSLDWVGYNFTYHFDVNLNNAPARLQMPLLISISDPVKESLGDSCYRIEINVTDQRKSPSLQVQARQLNGSGTLPLTLDKSVNLTNQSGLQFTRILCVDADTAFDLIAQNPFEQVALQIQLKTSEDFVVNVPTIYTRPPPPGLFNKTSAKDTVTQNLESVLLLVYVLFGLIILFLGMRFRHTLVYYGQSMLRYMNMALRGGRGGMAK